MCKVMHAGRTKLHSTYHINYTALESINEEQDLGIFISDDLKWSTHCQQAYTRANRVLGMINGTVISRDKELLTVESDHTLTNAHLRCQFVTIRTNNS